VISWIHPRKPIFVMMSIAGLKDGEPISQRDQQLVIPIVAQAFFDVEGALEMTKSSVTDAARAERKTRNA